VVVVAAGRRETSTLWGIAEANVATLLSSEKADDLQRKNGHNAVVAAALSELFQLNPRFKPELMDGVVSEANGDPDTILPGWKIQVERPPA